MLLRRDSCDIRLIYWINSLISFSAAAAVARSWKEYFLAGGQFILVARWPSRYALHSASTDWETIEILFGEASEAHSSAADTKKKRSFVRSLDRASRLKWNKRTHLSWNVSIESGRIIMNIEQGEKQLSRFECAGWIFFAAPNRSRPKWKMVKCTKRHPKVPNYRAEWRSIHGWSTFTTSNCGAPKWTAKRPGRSARSALFLMPKGKFESQTDEHVMKRRSEKASEWEMKANMH